MPEGETPCVDRCLDDATGAQGCYPGNGCRQFFVCSNTGSYGMCCPDGTTFVESSCSCEESVTCADPCVQTAPAIRTTVAPPQSFNDTVCQDSFGSYIATVAGEANAFSLVDDEGHPSTKMYCPTGYSFSLASCRCDIESGDFVPPTAAQRQAVVYVPFDSNTADKSVHNLAVFLYDGAQQTTDDSAIGGGSLRVNGGRAEIPGLQAFDSRNHGSWCAFFKCSGSCSQGGILSNKKTSGQSDYTVMFGTSTTSSFQGLINLWQPVGSLPVGSSAPGPVSGWNHFCTTYDSNSVVLYLNGNAVETQYTAGFLYVSKASFTIGSDQTLGSFNGWIDEVLIAPFAMTEAEVTAHRNGDQA